MAHQEGQEHRDRQDQGPDHGPGEWSPEPLAGKPREGAEKSTASAYALGGDPIGLSGKGGTIEPHHETGRGREQTDTGGGRAPHAPRAPDGAEEDADSPRESSPQTPSPRRAGAPAQAELLSSPADDQVGTLGSGGGRGREHAAGIRDPSLAGDQAELGGDRQGSGDLASPGI